MVIYWVVNSLVTLTTGKSRRNWKGKLKKRKRGKRRDLFSWRQKPL
jgi:hypothetical protein